MRFDHLSKIRANLALHTNKVTANVLDGDFKSIYRGRSLDFDDLREYAYGDNIKDIDWKSSSKTGKILVRRNIAYKKHNILFVADCGEKFSADTSAGESKQELAVLSCGTVAYLVDRHGDDFAMLRNSENGYELAFFASGKEHLERVLTGYEKQVAKPARYDVDQLLRYVGEHIRRKMVICVITDMDGLDRIGDDTLRRLTVRNDIMVINIDDAYLHGDRMYDVGRGRYEDGMITHNKRLFRAEYAARQRFLEMKQDQFERYGVNMTTIKDETEIVDRIAELFERRKHENIG